MHLDTIASFVMGLHREFQIRAIGILALPLNQLCMVYPQAVVYKRTTSYDVSKVMLFKHVHHKK